MNFKKIGMGITIGLLALSLGACSPAGSEAGTGDGTTEATEAPVVEKSLEVFGFVKGQSLPVSFDVELRVVEKLAKTGDLVHKGDPLLSFDREKVDKMADLKRLELTAASSKLDGGQVEGSKLRNTLISLESSLGQKREDLANKKKLYDEGMISKSEVTELETGIRTLMTEIENTRLSLSNQGASDSSVKATEQAEYRRVEIQYETFEALLKEGLWVQDNTIVSPFEEAIIEAFDIAPNAYAEPKSVILKLIDTKTLFIEAEVSEEFIRQVKVGNAVEIKPLFNKEKIYHGKVISISNLPYEKNGEMIVPVRIELSDRDGQLLPNFNVDVKIFTE
jgi:multidrug resistance efflux pump